MFVRTAALLASAALTSAQPYGAYLEADNLVAIELQSADPGPVGDWAFENSLQNAFDGSAASGEGYYIWRGPDLFGRPGHGTISFDVWITNPGLYKFQMHNYHGPGTGDDHCSDGSECNDIWVKVVGKVTTQGYAWDKAFSNKVSRWTWDTLFHHEHDETQYGQIGWELEAGLHTLQISGRSREMAVSRIHLTKKYENGPRQVCKPVSARQGYPAPVQEECAPIADQPPAADGFVYVDGVDSYGGDIWPSVIYNVESVEACVAHCKTVEACIVVTFHSWGGCFPKRTIGRRVEQGGAKMAYIASEGPGNGDGNPPPPPPPPPSPTNPAPTDPAGSYSYELIEGGCCRPADGTTGEYIHHQQIKDSGECAALCSAEADCKGYEITNYEGCELHVSVIDHVTNNPICQCFRRHNSAPTFPPTEPAPTEPAPTPPPAEPAFNFLGQGCCRTENGGSGTYTEHLSTAEADCNALCRADVGCTGYEMNLNTGTCETHTEPLTHTSSHGFCQCWGKL